MGEPGESRADKGPPRSSRANCECRGMGSEAVRPYCAATFGCGRVRVWQDGLQGDVKQATGQAERAKACLIAHHRRRLCHRDIYESNNVSPLLSPFASRAHDLRVIAKRPSASACGRTRNGESTRAHHCGNSAGRFGCLKESPGWDP